MKLSSAPLVIIAAIALAGLTACAPNVASSESQALTVDSTGTECSVSADTASSGTITFAVTNSGDDEAEFYLLGADGKDVIAEVEDIGPGLSRNLAVEAKAGKYFTMCKVSGESVDKQPFSVTD
jgi:iron uptake system component EfeO